MTKRFTLETECNHIGLPVANVIRDNLTGKKGYSVHDMVDFANEIYEEVQHLKEKGLENNCDNCIYSKAIYADVECRKIGLTNYKFNCDAFERERKGVETR